LIGCTLLLTETDLTCNYLLYLTNNAQYPSPNKQTV